MIVPTRSAHNPHMCGLCNLRIFRLLYTLCVYSALYIEKESFARLPLFSYILPYALSLP
jgi:hypothetical protein